MGPGQVRMGKPPPRATGLRLCVNFAQNGGLSAYLLIQISDMANDAAPPFAPRFTPIYPAISAPARLCLGQLSGQHLHQLRRWQGPRQCHTLAGPKRGKVRAALGTGCLVQGLARVVHLGVTG